MHTQMLEKCFVGILNMSLTACIIIPVVIALRFLLRKAPKIFSYILWAVVLFRLICPVSFSAAFSLLGALDAPKTERGQISYISVSTAEMPAAVVNQPIPAADTMPDGASFTTMPAADPMETVIAVGTWLWIAGVLALFLYSVATLVKLKRKLKTARYERDNIYIAENLTTPFVCGFFAPKIYLPAALAGEEKAYILMHEQIHIRRGDHIVKILGYLALCVHWFNPLVWAAFFLSGRDMEMSCDEAVIRKMGSGVKKEYSASLLNLATGRRIVGGVPLAFGEGDTGGRIKNVLGYKKPAAVLIGAVVVVLVAAAAVLLANPRKISASEGAKPAGEGELTEALYGVVGEYDGRYVVTIPVIGVVELNADNIETYFEPGEDGQDLRAGDLVEIKFAEGVDVQVLETYPARFVQPVEHVYIMQRGLALSYEGEDRYRISFPIGGPAVRGGEEVEAGDMLQIYRTDEYGENEVPWRMVPVLEVDKEKNQASIELSTEDTRVFLTELNRSISRVYIKVQDSAVRIGGEGNAETGGSPEEEQTPGVNAEGSYEVVILGLAEGEPHAVTAYALYEGYESRIFNVEEGDEPLVFSDDCVYLVNTAMETVHYEEVSYEEFVDTLVKWEDGFQWDLVQLTLRDNLIVEAAQCNAYKKYGISFYTKVPDHGYQDMLEIAGEDMLEQYYTLAGTETFDVADSDGDELIEIYTGNIGDGDSGLVLFRNAEGSLLYSEFAHRARAGWNNVYLGEIDGTGFIMNLWIEDRDDYGEYSYCVYRLSAEGEILLIAGSSFEWGLRMEYQDVFFQAWMNRLTYYLEHSHLILSSQEGELRTEQVSETDVYNYETLNLKGRQIG